MKQKILVFDFDGVIADSTGYLGKGLTDFLDNHNVSYPENIVEICMPLGYRGVAKYYHDELGLDIDIDLMEQMMLDNIYYYYANVIELKDGVREHLEKMKADGCSLNVLSAGAHRMMDACMERLGIIELFDHIWTCEDIGHKKSEVKIFEKVAGLMQVEPSEMVYFDDNIVALSKAKEAGFYTVGVYDESGKGFVEEMKAVGNQYIYSFDELKDIE